MFEDEEDHLATPSEACKEYARNYGMDHPDQAWVLTDFDTWERNPFYHGPPMPYPEDDEGFYPREVEPYEIEPEYNWEDYDRLYLNFYIVEDVPF